MIDVITQAVGSPDQAPRAAEKIETAKPNFRANVLLVEDNPVNLEVARQYLMELGCRVETAENGQEAVIACGRRRYDLVLMDCQMPVLDGLGATRKIRAMEQQSGALPMPVVAVTANAYEEDRRACLDAGMDDYLSKPFSPEQLVDVLEKWLKLEDSQSIARQAIAGNDEVTPALDEGFVRTLRGSRPQFFERVLDLFSGFAPGAMEQVRNCHLDQDPGAIMRLAHSLKSSSANIGATLLAGHCERLQQIAKAGWHADDIQLAIGDVEKELARVLSAVASQRQTLALAASG